MKIVTHTFKKLCFLATGLFLVYSCSNDAEKDEDVELTQTELHAILETEDVSGVVDTALYELFMNSGATGKFNSSNECYSAIYSDSGYTATFNNCVLNGTENVNGTLTVSYNLESEASSFTAMYTDFYVGSIKINGTKSYVVTANSNNSSISFETTSNLTLTMEEGSTISENGTKSFTLTFGDSLETTTFSIDGDWVVDIDGSTYTVAVNSVLEGNFACSYLNVGSMTVAKNGLSIIVDFGDGTCDDIATVIYPNGKVEEISLRD
ncbi:hypothetical protein [Maribacter arcticus]|uniref:Uncharacterized protein n=1 Tax=Maribacter arcticus TaxID=561365 RepID=A0A1T5CZD2_9FLAO|nr:hypothetical protein [Maribacter arcticus]SKB64683.1 hypothetical protein SAMN05660866_02547 [Maribacter arcticus]|tara:strand:+ start:1017 stop:1811 length:795 start_codon:yes stop_codon:yes gene_type:complete